LSASATLPDDDRRADLLRRDEIGDLLGDHRQLDVRRRGLRLAVARQIDEQHRVCRFELLHLLDEHAAVGPESMQKDHGRSLAEAHEVEDRLFGTLERRPPRRPAPRQNRRFRGRRRVFGPSIRREEQRTEREPGEQPAAASPGMTLRQRVCQRVCQRV
jgi:hypothetical protein